MSYQTKSTDSFKTRLRFYLFEKVLKYKNAEFRPSLQEFLDFDLRDNENLINKYTAEYYHKKRKDSVDGLVVDDIYKYIQQAEKDLKSKLEEWRGRYFIEVFPRLLTQNQYKELQNQTECFYCKTPLQMIRDLIDSGKIHKKNERGWTLEIDRKEPNQGSI